MNPHLIELKAELKERDWTILGLAELRRQGTGSFIDQDGTIKSYGGTGFLVNTNKSIYILSFKTYSHKIAKLIYQSSTSLSDKVKTKVI